MNNKNNSCVGIVTNKAFPELYDDDQLLALELRELGLKVFPVIWNDEYIDWADFDLLIIRSVWDYHLFAEEFQDWLQKIKDSGVPVVNSTSIIEKNYHKDYLIHFQDLGLNTIPTILIRKGQYQSLENLRMELKCQDIIIKPAISLGSHDTFKIKADEVSGHQNTFEEIVAKGDVLVQPFVPEILTGGEFSLIFIDKEFSHAIKKLPKAGDFRVQQQYGGSADLIQLPEGIISQAYQFLQVYDEDIIYARVDGIIKDDTFFLMELELIDPVLHFNKHPQSLKAFCQAALKRAPTLS